MKIQLPDEVRQKFVEAGRRGGSIGGPKRMFTLTPERRREIGQIAAKARWDKQAEKYRAFLLARELNS